METQQYYNAKPSKISNIGKDVSGAKRMNFDTYESIEERQAKEKRKATDKKIGLVKEELKLHILSEIPCIETILNLKAEIFQLEHGFDPRGEDSRAIIMERRSKAIAKDERSAFNKMVNSYNRLKNETYKLTHHAKYYLPKMAAKYASKKTFTENSGISYDWKQFKATESSDSVVNFLNHNASAVQFGNSVSDNERAYICLELSDFIARWRTDTRLNRVSLMPVNWSFGARGRAGSVAYYQASSKVISVNRNNIGSLIHELGHYIDDITGNISNRISYETVSTYRDSLEGKMDQKSLRYYCKRCEIFARAFEAYCYSIDADFAPFAQAGKDYLPQLNDELIGLIEKALGKSN